MSKMAKAKRMLAKVCNSECDKVYNKLDDTVCTRYDDFQLRRRSSSKTLLLPVGVPAVMHVPHFTVLDLLGCCKSL